MEEQACAIGSLFFVLFAVFAALVATGLMTLVYCMIFYKAGYSWALGLLMLVPVANLIMPFILAFGAWPVLRELQMLRQQQGSPPG